MKSIQRVKWAAMLALGTMLLSQAAAPLAFLHYYDGITRLTITGCVSTSRDAAKCLYQDLQWTPRDECLNFHWFDNLAQGGRSRG